MYFFILVQQENEGLCFTVLCKSPKVHDHDDCVGLGLKPTPKSIIVAWGMGVISLDWVMCSIFRTMSTVRSQNLMGLQKSIHLGWLPLKFSPSIRDLGFFSLQSVSRLEYRAC